MVSSFSVGRPSGAGRRREAPSRVMFGPHETNLGEGRRLSDCHNDYYAARAAGGAGVIVIEEASVHPSDWPYERAPLATLCSPGWAAIVQAIRDTGTTPVVLAALGHSGGQGTSHWSQRELWAPSAVPEVATREVPKVMELADIDAVVSGFAEATRLAVAAGLDGVEINAGQFSMIRQFLSGLTNMRTDEYGGDRLLFARRVLESVRSAAGDAIVALRLSVDELAPWAGIVPQAGAEIAVQLSEFVDLISVVRGSIYSAALTRPDGHAEPGFAIDLAREVRVALQSEGKSVPVVAQGSIVDWGQAEWVIADGAADAVEMTRAQIADPDLVSKVRDDQSARIRPCILCNQTCKVRDNRNPVITCVVNPRAGHERTDPPDPTPGQTMPRSHALTLRAVSIIGGGVAGLEAARVAALAGRSVTLFERTSQFGGILRAAANGAGRERLARYADWLESECRALGVDMRADVSVQVAQIDELIGDVIIATGSIPAPLPFTVSPEANVIEAAELLRDIEGFCSRFASGNVVVWDPIGGPIALSVAELLAPRGCAVTLVTPDLIVGEKLSLSGDLAPSQGRLHAAGIAMIKRAIVRSVARGEVIWEDRFTAVRSTISCDVLVSCQHRIPNQELDPAEQLLQIGDRVAPRTILEATLEARRSILSISAPT